MCAAAHAWVGLGRIVYVSSTEQMVGWLAELGAGSSPVRPLPITEVAPGLLVHGPVPAWTSRSATCTAVSAAEARRAAAGFPGRPALLLIVSALLYYRP